MVLISALKLVAIALCVTPLAGCAIGGGLIFAAYIMGSALNPEAADDLFNTAVITFAFLETFAVMGILTAVLIYFA